jgi:hypothetical protein
MVVLLLISRHSRDPDVKIRRYQLLSKLMLSAFTERTLSDITDVAATH